MRAPGRYGDGGGLVLQVQSPTRKSWVFRFMRDGKAREMGLGAFPAVSLADARQKARDAHTLLDKGVDPLDAKHAALPQPPAPPPPPSGMTFAQAADSYIEAHRKGWRSAKHGGQWQATLATYAFPAIGSKLARDVEVEDVRSILAPIWTTKNETANRVRGRIEMILDFASIREGWADTKRNPAAWKGRQEHLFPAPSKVSPVEHFPALPWRELPAFMTALRQREGTGASALQLTVLTAARSGSVFAARWSEFDLAGGVWTVPPEHMKAKRAFSVPLSAQAVALLQSLPSKDEDGLVFPGDRQGRPISNMTMTAVLRRMGHAELTVHGFRSTFRDWCGEATDTPRELAEMSLAHVVGDETENAYKRGDMLERRRRVMQAWADYGCGA